VVACIGGDLLQTATGNDVTKAVKTLRKVAYDGRALRATVADHPRLLAARDAQQKRVQVLEGLALSVDDTVTVHEQWCRHEILNAALSYAQAAEAAGAASTSAIENCLQAFDAAMDVLNDVMASVTTQFGNKNPLSLFGTLIGDVEDLSFARSTTLSSSRVFGTRPTRT
jgi:hypothetical protein